MIRRKLICDCGNRDDEDVPTLEAPLPICSDDCGRRMKIESIESTTGWDCTSCGDHLDDMTGIYGGEGGKLFHDKFRDSCGPIVPAPEVTDGGSGSGSER
jgi:hypothetical protein